MKYEGRLKLITKIIRIPKTTTANGNDEDLWNKNNHHDYVAKLLELVKQSLAILLTEYYKL